VTTIIGRRRQIRYLAVQCSLIFVEVRNENDIAPNTDKALTLIFVRIVHQHEFGHVERYHGIAAQRGHMGPHNGQQLLGYTKD
jgi:hypothetical protein